MKNKTVNYRFKKVTLEFYELAMGEFIANLRISESKRLGLKERFDTPMSKEHNFNINLRGTLGEIAVAKYLNQYWAGTVNTFHTLSDVGLEVEVRTTIYAEKKLILRDNDPEDAYYFQVLQMNNETFRILGFIHGSYAKVKEYYYTTNERPKAYFIPQSDLIKPTLENLKKHRLIL